MDAETLIDRARDAATAAYVPYSEYAVGAALAAADGSITTGANVEIVNYSNTLHAEEVALGQAVHQGHTEFSALAVASGARDGVTPCGMCRQSLAEFCPQDFPIYCDDGGTIETYTLGELLPATMSEETIA